MARPKRENLKRLNFYVPGDLGQWLEKESDQTGLSMAAVVIMALHSYRKEQLVVNNPAMFSDMAAMVKAIQGMEQREAGDGQVQIDTSREG